MITQIIKIELDVIFSIKPFSVTDIIPLFNLRQVLHHHNDTTNIEFKLDPNDSLCGDVYESIIESHFNTKFL